MSETTTSTEPSTGPIATTPPPADPPAAPRPVYDHHERRPSRLNVVAAWVGIVAGIVFVVAVIFGTGFMLGAHSGGQHRGDDFGDRRGAGEMHREGPPMGPIFRPGPGFIFPGGPGGPGGMGPGGPGQAPTTAPTPPTR